MGWMIHSAGPPAKIPMADNITEMQEYYRLRAAEYDASMRYDDPGTSDYFEPVFRALREALAGRDVLELACGPGYWTSNICKAVKSIVATDYNESTLEEARRKDLDSGKVTLQCADAYNLDFPDMQFTAVLAVDWFAHVPKPLIASFLEGLHRVVSSGAVICFCDGMPKPHSLTGVYDDDGNHIQQRTLADGSRYSVIKNYFSFEDVERIFSAYASQLDILEFPECLRKVIRYTLK